MVDLWFFDQNISFLEIGLVFFCHWYHIYHVFFLITAEVNGFLNLGIHKSMYCVHVKATLFILLSVSCWVGIVINLRSIVPINFFFLFNEKWNLSHCLSHIICWKFKLKCDCLEVVAVSMDNDLCYSGGKCGAFLFN